MSLRDLLVSLRGQGLVVTETQLCWAIKTGKVSRLPLDVQRPTAGARGVTSALNNRRTT